jgi:hypothetical protein
MIPCRAQMWPVREVLYPVWHVVEGYLGRQVYLREVLTHLPLCKREHARWQCMARMIQLPITWDAYWTFPLWDYMLGLRRELLIRRLQRSRWIRPCEQRLCPYAAAPTCAPLCFACCSAMRVERFCRHTATHSNHRWSSPSVTCHL